MPLNSRHPRGSRRGVSEVMGALLLIVVVIVAVAALASFVSIAEKNAQARSSYITSVQDENLQVVDAIFAANQTAGLAPDRSNPMHWNNITLTVRNTNTASSDLFEIRISNSTFNYWVPSYSTVTAGDILGENFNTTTESLTFPARGTITIFFKLTNLEDTLGFLRSSPITITLLTRAGNFFTTYYDPPAAAFSESIVQSPFMSTTRDLLEFNAAGSTNGNSTIQSYQWSVQVPPKTWDGNWADDTVQTFAVTGREWTYPDSILSQMTPTQLAGLQETGPIRVTLTVVDGASFTSSSGPTVVDADPLIAPPAGLALISNTLVGTCHNDQATYCYADLSVNVTDIFGHPMNGQVVDFTTSSGNITSFSPTFQSTSSEGEATTTVQFGAGGGVVEVVDQSNPGLKLLVSETGSGSTLIVPTPTPTSQTVYLGQTATISDTQPTTGTSPYTYQWLEEAPGASSYTNAVDCGASMSSPPQCVFATTGATTVGTYSFELKVTDSSTPTPETAVSSPVTVTVSNSLFAGPITPASPVIDSGQTVTLTANPSGGTAPYTYEWFTGSTGCTGTPFSGPTMTATIPVSPTTTTTYYYQVTDTVPESSCSAGDVVTVNPAMTAPTIAPTHAAVDVGQTDQLSISTPFAGGTAPYSCQWQEVTPTAQPIGGPVSCSAGGALSTTTPTLTMVETYTFDLQVTDNTGATVTSATTSVTVNSDLVAAVVSATPTAILEGQSSTLSTSTDFSGGTNPYTCQWLQESPGAGGFSPLGSSFSCALATPYGVTTGPLSATGSWNFEFQVTDNAGALATSAEVTVSVNPPLTAPVISASPTAISSGATTTLSTTTGSTGGVSPYTCQWLEEAPGDASYSDLGASFSGSANQCAPGDTPTVTTPDLTTDGTYSFELQVTDSLTPTPETVYSNAVTVTVSDPASPAHPSVASNLASDVLTIPFLLGTTWSQVDLKESPKYSTVLHSEAEVASEGVARLRGYNSN
ncbi:MAG TPA: archaellin/type IV pilin N-terminal domain-containing protein [Nitrososphaerales archaeon]|nr:archaellin/type IV pilin N-terminal domain-containing protein [Nitrososphaerales archaeon]